MALGRLGSSLGGGVTARFPIGNVFQIEPGVEWRHLDIAATSRFLEVASTANTGSQWTGSLAARWSATDRLTFDAKVLGGRNASLTGALSSRRFGLEGAARYEFDPPSETIGWRWSVTPFVRYLETARSHAPDALLSIPSSRASIASGASARSSTCRSQECSASPRWFSTCATIRTCPIIAPAPGPA